MTQTVQPELLAVSPVGANLIINGDMRIAQRGTSFAGYTTANSGAVTLDRFKYYSTGAETVTISQDTDVPSGQGFTTSLKVDVTTADATVGAGETVRIETPLEGNDVAHLMFGTANAKQATLSFWVKSPKTGAHYVNFSESSSYARCYPALYTVSVADTWEYKTITLTGDITGTWGTGSGVGLTAGFVLMAGSSFLGTADTWQAASVFAASGVVNCMDNVANNFFLTGVKLEVGSTATAFVPDDYGTALAKCRRYYQIIGGAVNAFAYKWYQTTNNYIQQTLTLAAAMRAIPTLTKNGTWNTTNCGQPTFSSAHPGTIWFQSQTTSTGASGLYTDSTDDTVEMDAEL